MFVLNKARGENVNNISNAPLAFGEHQIGDWHMALKRSLWIQTPCFALRRMKCFFLFPWVCRFHTEMMVEYVTRQIIFTVALLQNAFWSLTTVICGAVHKKCYGNIFDIDIIFFSNQLLLVKIFVLWLIGILLLQWLNCVWTIPLNVNSRIRVEKVKKSPVQLQFYTNSPLWALTN